MMPLDPGAVLHTGGGGGVWATVEVAFAVAVLGSAVALVVALLSGARDGTPEARLAAAFTREGDGDGDPTGDGDSSLDRSAE